MTKQEIYLPSGDGKTQLHTILWLPEGTPRAILQISHGVSEYIGRYERLAQVLTAQGFLVAGHDHLGHGLSVADGGARLYFGEAGSWDTVTDDLYRLHNLLRRDNPGIPFFLLGHSMGSFLARTYLIRYPGTVDAAVLMGTGQMPAPLVTAGLAVARMEGRRLGWEQSSALIDRLAFGAYNKQFAPNRTAFDWLSVNPDNVDAYIADPLCGGSASAGLFREMLGGIRFITDGDNLKKMNGNTPILFLSGEDDPVGDGGKGVRRACHSFRKAGVRSAEMKLYPGLRHELLNEACHETVEADLLRWLEKQLAAIRETRE
ncbi:MAG: alpha/beta hydrolase, partial [Oscillospiraceae bacterium]